MHGRSMASAIIERIHKMRMNARESAPSSNCNFGRPRAFNSAPIDAFQKHRKLSATESHGTTLGLWPYKTTTLQPLGEEAQTITIPPQQLHDIASAPAEHEDMARKRLLLQNRLHLRTEAIETAPHIGHAGGKPYPGPCGKMNHWRRLSSTQRSSRGSAPLSTVSTARPGSSM